MLGQTARHEVLTTAQPDSAEELFLAGKEQVHRAHREAGKFGDLLQRRECETAAAEDLLGAAMLVIEATGVTAQGRITGWILCIMPFLMFGLLSMLNWNTEKVLFTDHLGKIAVYIGMGFMVCGILAIRHIVNVKV